MCMHLICSLLHNSSETHVWPLSSSRPRGLIISRATMESPKQQKIYGRSCAVGRFARYLHVRIRRRSQHVLSMDNIFAEETCLHKEFLIGWGRSWSGPNPAPERPRNRNRLTLPHCPKMRTFELKASRLRRGSKPEYTSVRCRLLFYSSYFVLVFLLLRHHFHACMVGFMSYATIFLHLSVFGVVFQMSDGPTRWGTMLALAHTHTQAHAHTLAQHD